MSFEYFVDKEEKTKKLDTLQEEEVVKSVSSDFTAFHNARKENFDKAKRLEDEVFFRTESVQPDSGERDNKNEVSDDGWKTKAKMCKTYMFYCTLLAFIWKNVYQSVSSMFDVSGENQEADSSANKQKAMLVDIFEKMEFTKAFDKMVRNFMIYGEVISYTAWSKQYEEVRRPITLDTDINKLPQVIAAKLRGENFYTDLKKIYDNPKVYAVNPADFVFDVSQEDNFDAAPKIYRTWKTPEEIINNKFYTIDNETKQDLKDMVSSNNGGEELAHQSEYDLEEETTNRNTIEILEYWGNFRMKDGTLLKNWHIVIAARKHLLKFEKNYRIINPFTFGGFLQDPKTKRHFSPLYCVLSLANMQEKFMNRTCDLQALEENPPIYAPKGLFTEKEKKLYPGKIIEFGDGLTPEQIKEMKFPTNVYLQNISYISDLMAEVSGIFPNMIGQNEVGNKTATEISTKTEGQMTRLSMIIDFINQYGVIPIVKNVAKLKSDFTFGSETIYQNKNNQPEVLEIDDSVRQGEYKYTYSDRVSMSEKSNKADMIVNACKEFAQFIPLNAQEIFTFYMEQKGVENPERFLQQQDHIPPEIQQNLMNIPQFRAFVENFEAQKQNMNNQQQPVNNALPDTNIPQQQAI